MIGPARIVLPLVRRRYSVGCADRVVFVVFIFGYGLYLAIPLLRDFAL